MWWSCGGRAVALGVAVVVVVVVVVVVAGVVLVVTVAAVVVVVVVLLDSAGCTGILLNTAAVVPLICCRGFCIPLWTVFPPLQVVLSSACSVASLSRFPSHYLPGHSHSLSLSLSLSLSFFLAAARPFSV